MDYLALMVQQKPYTIIDNAINDLDLLEEIKNDKDLFPAPTKIATDVVNLVHAKERAPITYKFWPGWSDSEPVLLEHFLIKALWENELPIPLEQVYGFEYWSRTFVPGQYSMWHFDRGFGRGIEKTLNYVMKFIIQKKETLPDNLLKFLGEVFAVVRCSEMYEDRLDIKDGVISYVFDYDCKNYNIKLTKKNIKHFISGLINGHKKSEQLFDKNLQKDIDLLEDAQNNYDFDQLKEFMVKKYRTKHNQAKLTSISSSDQISRCMTGCVYYPPMNDVSDPSYLQLLFDGNIIEIESRPNRLVIFDSATIFHQSTSTKKSLRYSFPINVWTKNNPPNKLDEYYFETESEINKIV